MKKDFAQKIRTSQEEIMTYFFYVNEIASFGMVP